MRVARMPARAAVIMGMASMETQGFMSHIHEYAEHFEFLRILSCLNLASYPFCEDQKYEGRFLNENWFYGPSNRMAAAKGYDLVTFIPNNLHQAGTNKIKALKDEGIPIVYWGPVTPMQEKSGFFNLGLSNVYEMEVIEAADIVILEVNDKVPWTHGDVQIHISQVDNIVEFSKPLPTIPLVEPGIGGETDCRTHCRYGERRRHSSNRDRRHPECRGLAPGRQERSGNSHRDASPKA